MKTIKQTSLVLLFYFVAISVNAQIAVDAGVNKINS